MKPVLSLMPCGPSSQKKTGDYHEEMDGKSFENWFTKVLPMLEENCVIVLDNASYHSRKAEKIPTTATRKAEIQDWLRSKSISFEDSMVKVELLRIVNENKTKYNKNIVDEIAKAHNRTVLRLPPYHCELNPIELIWAEIKNYVANKNTTFKFCDIKNIFHDAVISITPEKWKNCVEHVRDKVEQKMLQLDHLIDEQVDRNPLIINLDDDSSSLSSSDFD